MQRLSPTDIEIAAEPLYGGVPATAGKVAVACLPSGTRNTVVVTLGQSLAGNSAEGRYAAQHDVVNFSLYDGRCYRAADPLLGAAGKAGNFATRLGDVLVQRRLAERVVLAPIAVGGTRVEHWSPGGVLHPRIRVLIRRLHDAGLRPDWILWQQGESNGCDVDPGGQRYRDHLLEIIRTFRRYSIDAPFLIALGAHCDAVRTGTVTVEKEGPSNSAGDFSVAPRHLRCVVRFARPAKRARG